MQVGCVVRVATMVSGPAADERVDPDDIIEMSLSDETLQMLREQPVDRVAIRC
jgi:hypothetical protein